MTDLSTISAATDDNQLGAHLCRTWDEQRAAGMVSGKWAPAPGRFVTLAEWVELQKAQKDCRNNNMDKIEKDEDCAGYGSAITAYAALAGVVLILIAIYMMAGAAMTVMSAGITLLIFAMANVDGHDNEELHQLRRRVDSLRQDTEFLRAILEKYGKVQP